MNKCFNKLYKKVILITIMIVILPGCSSINDASQPLSSAENLSSIASDQDDLQSTLSTNNDSATSDTIGWKNITCKVRLMRANKDWYGAEYEPLSENSRYQTYSIDYPDFWVSIYDKYESSFPPENENGHRVFHANGTKIAEVITFYIPEGMAIPDNYFELAFSDEEGENPSFPKKVGDIKAGSLTGEVAKETGSYVDDNDLIKDYEHYVYYLTDGKTVINIAFYINENTKEYINTEIMEKIINSIKFLE